MSSIDEIVNSRIKKIELLKKANIHPYPSVSHRELSVREAFEQFDVLSKSSEKKWLAGRIMSIREQGAIIFINFNDGTGSFQGLIKKGIEKFDFFREFIDIGDFIEVYGSFFLTKRGEKTIEISDLAILSKSLRPLPEKWHGLQDFEERFRKRYLDILFNQDIKDLFVKKEKFWRVIRAFLQENNFLEVETPSLEITTGGAEATPFKTHHEAFDLPVYLRISIGELWQKRLLAAGFNKVFEVGRAYRNEGVDINHSPEFTNVEFYWAYSDYNELMDFIEKLYRKIAQDVFSTMQFETRGHKFDLKDPWPKIDYVETVKKETGIDVLKDSYEEIENKLKELGVVYDGNTRERLVDSLWKYCRKKISGPVFLMNHPKIVSPLAKVKADNQNITERFQVIIAGAEVGNGFSELNDPIDQRERFKVQQELLNSGDKEAMMPDLDFVEMLEYGMPPACGFGFGEMLFAFLSDRTIRETQLFPLMKPK